MAQAEGRDRAVAGPVASFSVQNYSAIVYGKGPLFFDAVRQRLGDQAFFTALQTYLQAHLYGIAYPPDLVSAFTQSSGQSIDDLYDFWIMGESQATPTP
jgi:aminopeptidase N